MTAAARAMTAGCEEVDREHEQRRGHHHADRDGPRPEVDERKATRTGVTGAAVSPAAPYRSATSSYSFPSGARKCAYR